jgi:hypothetical protein
MANGNMIYKPVTKVDFTSTLPLAEKEKELFANFKLWVQNINQGIKKTYDLKSTTDMSLEDEDTVNSFIDVTNATDVA